jgi:hypothetical protein
MHETQDAGSEQFVGNVDHRCFSHVRVADEGKVNLVHLYSVSAALDLPVATTHENELTLIIESNEVTGTVQPSGPGMQFVLNK